MTANPFQSPRCDSGAIAAATRAPRELRKIIACQRILNLCAIALLIDFATILLGFLSLNIALLATLAFFGLTLASSLLTARLATLTNGLASGAVLGALAAVPMLGLFALWTADAMATRVLRRHGVQVSFLGADSLSVARLQAIDEGRELTAQFADEID